MLEYLLHDHISYPALGYILNYGVYYPLIFLAAVVGVVGVYRRLLELDYDKKRIRLFVIISAALVYPSVIAGARMANMFYSPKHMWSFSFFIEQFMEGKFVTFHAGFIFTFFLFSAIVLIMKLRYWDIADTFFLFIPLGHAIGRTACFLVGCCWGSEVTCSIFGNTYSFDNPVPLYVIIINASLFFGLRWCYNKIYREGYSQYKGLIVALYFIIYGNVRFFMEGLRTELVIAWGLTQAQIVMFVFIFTGLIIFFIKVFGAMASESEKTGSKNEDKGKYVFSIIGFLISFILFISISYFLLDQKIVKWPFQTIKTLSDSVFPMIVYSPFLIFSIGSIYWLKRAGLSIWDYFRWKKFSYTFIIGLAVSLGYAVFLMEQIRFGIDGGLLWITIIILSVMNAFAEEVLFRGILYQLLRNVMTNRFTAIFLQSVAYSIIHAYIGGPFFAVLSIFYGIIMGFIFEKSESLVPCFICHFIIDLGVIGFPILSGL